MSPKTGELLVKEVAPRLHSLAPSLTPIGCEDLAEQVADAIAVAAALLVSATARGKRISAGNVAFYAIRLVRQGRRSTGQSKTDPMHPAAQITGRCRMMSMEEPIAGYFEDVDTMCLHDVLATREEDPSMAASRRLDWEHLVARLDTRTREVLHCLLDGHDLTVLVPKLKRSRSAIQTDKERLAGLVRDHFGPDILLQVQEQPRWRDSVEANRERVACRQQQQTV
jgi:hypothetical protein